MKSEKIIITYIHIYVEFLKCAYSITPELEGIPNFFLKKNIEEIENFKIGKLVKKGIPNKLRRKSK